MAATTAAASAVEQDLVEEAYLRMHIMMRASHILLALPDGADDRTASLVMRSARELKRRIEYGESVFADVAIAWSDDPSVTSNAGDLGYFSVFEQPYEVENAAFLTDVGAVSSPVRSRFGIHLVLPTERLAIAGLKRASHIMVKDGLGSEQRIRAIRNEVTQANFAQLAQRYSADTRTRDEGGDLGTDRLVDELESVRLRLEIGEISAPVRTTSGWHILMVTEIEPFPDLEEMRPELLERIRRNERGLMLTD